MSVTLQVIVVPSSSSPTNFIRLPSRFVNGSSSSSNPLGISAQNSQGVVSFRLKWDPTSSTGSSSSSSSVQDEGDGSGSGISTNYAYVGWKGEVLMDGMDDAIGIPFSLARNIGLLVDVKDNVGNGQQGQPDWMQESLIPLDTLSSLSSSRDKQQQYYLKSNKIRISQANQLAPLAIRAEIEPLTFNDWEIVESNAGFIENEMLPQICVVYPNEIFSIWVRNIEVRFKVLNVYPSAPCVKFSNKSEVLVKPKVRSKEMAAKENDKPKSIRLRVQVSALAEENAAYLHPRTIGQLMECCKWPHVQGKDPVRVSSKSQSLIAWTPVVDDSSKAPAKKKFPLLIHSGSEHEIAPGHVALSETTCQNLGVQACDSIVLSYDVHPPLPLSRIVVNVHSDSDAELIDKLKSKTQPLLLVDDAFVSTAKRESLHKISIQEVLASADQAYSEPTPNTFTKFVLLSNPSEECTKIKFKLRNAQVRPRANQEERISLSDLGGIQTIADSMRNVLLPVLSRAESEYRVSIGVPSPGGVYLHGSRGSGKTSIARAICNQLNSDSNVLAKVIWISCAELRGGKRSHIETTFRNAVIDAAKYAPSVIVFDDLDLLLPSSGGGAGEDAQTAWLGETVEEMLSEQRRMFESFERAAKTKVQPKDYSWNCRAVTWIATGQNSRSLRGNLLKCGLFDTSVEVPPLSAQLRSQILRNLVTKVIAGMNSQVDQIASKIDFDDISSRAEGCTAADLRMLTMRAVNVCLRKENEMTLTHADFIHALEGFSPAALRGVKLSKSTVQWSDIGGLYGVRRVLKETLELPIQFAPLYERSPQRLASGILLYGPPGCGKTLLAGAVAKECGLNFISVKGPEVLNKYIGASEQAIRDLFARGAAAIPSIIFFDEFDAIAPRRGSDSTGVTDRVVNQLLTFLDGVESRSGVYVMAATSRPDLIDPALLRPGRLDKQLMCGFPNEEEREDILRTVAAKMAMSESANAELPKIARLPETENFTGADLQALLFTAQLKSVHAKLGGKLEMVSREGGGGGGVRMAQSDASSTMNGASAAGNHSEDGRITAEDLIEALKETRASTSKSDRDRFNKIYAAFSGDRSGDFSAPSGVYFEDGKQRTALM